MSNRRKANALLQECYGEYRVKLFSYCLSRLDGSREAADDCVQEAFIVFYKKLLDGEDFENPRAFLYRTADNFVKRQRQNSAKKALHEVPLDEARDSAVESEYFELLEILDYEECAKRLIERLDSDEQQLYEMRYQQKASVESIAQTLGISRPAASMRLIRMRNKIKDMVYNISEKGG